MKETSLFFLVVLASVTFASGQVVVKQANQEISYVSPMVLEVPIEPYIAKARSLPPPSGFNWDAGNPHHSQKIEELAKYVCESVSIKNLVLVAYGSNKKGLQKIQFITSISVRPGSDKYVVITYELVSEGRSLAKVRTKRINAEEKKTTTDDTNFLLQTKDINIETPMILRITMNVEDNG